MKVVFNYDEEVEGKNILNFSLFFIRNGGLYFSDSCIMRGVIVKDITTNLYSVIFNDNWTDWNTYTGDKGFSSISDIKTFFEEDCPTNLLDFMSERVNDLEGVQSSTNAWFRYVKDVYNTVLRAMEYSYNALPVILFNNEEITVTFNKSKIGATSVYERSPTRLGEYCIMWHGIGTVMLKLNQNFLTGKCTIIPVCIYQDYDRDVRYWNDIRLGYTIVPNSSYYNEAVWRGFNPVDREKQLELLLEFDSIAEVYAQLKNQVWLDGTYKADYFWKVAETFGCLKRIDGLCPLDLIHNSLFGPSI